MLQENNFYLSEISKIPLLSLEEEKSLATKAFSGDKTAQKKLVEANLRFVVRIANKYASFMDVEDLINEGNIGLMKAAEKFNPASGTRFITYGVYWIKAYIEKAIRETSLGVKFPATKFQEMKKSKWKFISLDKVIPGQEDDGATLKDIIPDSDEETPEDIYLRKEVQEIVNSLVKKLNKKEELVLIKRFGLDGDKPMSLSEVGKFMDYSKERIRQLEKTALANMKVLLDKVDFSLEDVGMAA